MGYWKREYTARRGGVPLFKPEPKEATSEEPEIGEPACDEASIDAQPAQATGPGPVSASTLAPATKERSSLGGSAPAGSV